MKLRNFLKISICHSPDIWISRPVMVDIPKSRDGKVQNPKKAMSFWNTPPKTTWRQKIDVGEKGRPFFVSHHRAREVIVSYVNSSTWIGQYHEKDLVPQDSLIFFWLDPWITASQILLGKPGGKRFFFHHRRWRTMSSLQRFVEVCWKFQQLQCNPVIIYHGRCIKKEIISRMKEHVSTMWFSRS